MNNDIVNLIHPQYISQNITSFSQYAAKHRTIHINTPRRSGKTSTLRRIFDEYAPTNTLMLDFKRFYHINDSYDYTKHLDGSYASGSTSNILDHFHGRSSGKLGMVIIDEPDLLNTTSVAQLLDTLFAYKQMSTGFHILSVGTPRHKAHDQTI